MRPPPRRALSIIILAGGQGTRMGRRDKARLRLRSSTLLAQLCASLRPQAAEIIVVRRRPRAALGLPAGLRLAWDRQRDQGPVAGLEAGLRRARHAWCLCLPVDSLQPPASLLRQLSNQQGHGAYGQDGETPCYLHALLPRRLHFRLHEFLNHGGRSAANACARLDLEAIELEAGNRTVWSINTRTQWRQVRRRSR